MKIKHNPKLYEINTAVWLHELSSEYGKDLTIGKVPPEKWDELKEFGFDYIWLMGVWKRSKAGLEIFRRGYEYASFQRLLDSILPGWTDDDLIGSPYSIAEYSPDSIIGNWRSIDKARAELNKRGMGLILDFVPNHTALDHPWVYKHPDYYIQGSGQDFKKNPSLYSVINNRGETSYLARGKDPYFLPWTDTVQLNYFNPEMRSALFKEIKKIAKHCDGVRCDMAMLVLNDIFEKNWGWTRNSGYYMQSQPEFWEEAISSMPEFLFIAEAYWDTEWRLQQTGFDYAYDKRLYDRLISSSAGPINEHLKADLSFQEKLVRFIENHDELRSAEILNEDRLYAAAVILTTLPGLKLYHQGQMEGKKIKIPLQIRRVRHEEPDMDVRAFYEKLLHITKTDIFRNGTWKLKETTASVDNSFENIIAYVWKLDKKLKLIAVNISPHTCSCRISLKQEITTSKDYILYDELNGKTYVRNAGEMSEPGLMIILEGFHAHIFDISLKNI